MEPKEIINEFFNFYSSGQVDRSVDFIASTNPWLERAADSLAHLKSQLHSLASTLGEYYEHQLIAEKSLGDRMMGFCYVAIFDRQPVRFIFVFYKPQEKWKMQKINFDMDLDDDLEESIKQSVFI